MHHKDSTHMHGMSEITLLLLLTRLWKISMSNLCFRFALLRFPTCIFYYHSPAWPSCSVVDALFNNIDKAMIRHHSANIICCPFPWDEWCQDILSLFCYLSGSYWGSQLFSTYSVDWLNHDLLDLFLFSNPEKCSISPPWGNSNHLVISVDP